MKLEDQVVSLELAKKLKELGVKQESLFWWNCEDDGDGIIDTWIDQEEVGANCSAFTVAELGEMLPEDRCYYEKEMVWFYSFYAKQDNKSFGESVMCNDDKEADARAKLLIHLIEEGVMDKSLPMEKETWTDEQQQKMRKAVEEGITKL